MEFQRAVRYPLMAAGMISLLVGMAAGLLRIDLNLFLIRPSLAAVHGPLMVAGFLGTVIGLERAVALGRTWGYAAPFFSAVGGIWLVAGGGEGVGAALFLVSSVFMVSIYAVILRRQREIFNLVMTLGAAAWGVGNLYWLLQYPIGTFVLWWGGFVVLTIAGERLELSRFVQPPRLTRILFAALMGVMLAGMIAAPFNPGPGSKAFGAAMAAAALWLFVYDIPRRTIRQTGLTRFVAASLLPGYFWMGVSGLFLVFQQGWPAGPFYDPVLHSLFLGFAFSMIFGHAPIIFPAVLKVEVPYSPAFYVHLALLHASLLARVLGTVLDSQPAHTFGGALNAVALLVFLANTVVAVARGAAKPA